MPVRYGLNAIKGMGSATAPRDHKGSRGRAVYFPARFSFRGSIRERINRRALESLISAGALDSLAPADSTINQWRPRLFAGSTEVCRSRRMHGTIGFGANRVCSAERPTETLEPDLP
jgi:DNA polymerase III alpha subunit